MISLSLESSEIKPAVINLLANFLMDGKIIVLPTDTIYGLSCLADNSSAIKRIYSLKKREATKPLIILVSSLAMLKKYVFVSKSQISFLKQIWNNKDSRPTTFILRKRGLLPRELAKSSDSLAVRLPKSKFLIRILKKVNRPLVSTSLNLSGKKNIYNLQSLVNYFPNKQLRPDLVVDIGKYSRVKSSRLIDLRDVTNPLILRK